jgi:hypothetical protein
MKKAFLLIILLLILVPLVSSNFFSPLVPPPTTGATGPAGPQGPPGSPGNFSINDSGLVLNSFNELSLNYTLLNILYNDTFLILNNNNYTTNMYFSNTSTNLTLTIERNGMSDLIASTLLIHGPKGDTGNTGPQGENGTSVNISSVVNNGDGTYTWYFSDGFNFTTGNLTGPQGEQGLPGINGENGTNGINGINGTSFSIGDSYFYDNGSNIIFFNESKGNETWLTIVNWLIDNSSIWNSINIINQSIFYINESNDSWVRKTGDNMTGNLSMTNNSILGVDVLEVHNITGQSPIFVTSEMISVEDITAKNFYGNIDGNNGSITNVNIINGSIENLHVTKSSLVDGNMSVNDTFRARYYGSFSPIVFVDELGYPIAKITSNETTENITVGYLRVDQLVVNRLQILGLLNYSDTEPPDYYFADNNYLYRIKNNVTFTFYFNETKLNNTINNISQVMKFTLNITCTAVGGVCGVVSSINITHLITETKIIPTTSTNNYKSEVTEYPITTNIIDKSRATHVGVWDIEKNYAVNSQVVANITSANIDELFTIQIIYLTNGVQ